MAGDQRTVLSTKRARDRRQRAQRRASNKRQLDDGPAPVLATRTAAPLEPLLAVRDCSAAASPTGADDALDDDAYAECDRMDDDDDELVIVGRATPADFCTRLVPAEQLAGGCREFAAAIPSFRETSDGFTAYTIALLAGGGERFELERRYSEFVALATALRGDASPGASPQQRGGSEAEESDDGAAPPAAVDGAFEWELPPKTWFKLTQLPALEERRRQLELSLVRLLTQPAMTRRALVRDFLMLDIFGAQVAEEAARAGE